MADSQLNITVKTQTKELQDLIDKVNTTGMTVKEFDKGIREIRNSSNIGGQGLKDLKAVVTQVADQTAAANSKMMQSQKAAQEQLRDTSALQKHLAAMERVSAAEEKQITAQEVSIQKHRRQAEAVSAVTIAKDKEAQATAASRKAHSEMMQSYFQTGESLRVLQQRIMGLVGAYYSLRMVFRFAEKAADEERAFISLDRALKQFGADATTEMAKVKKAAANMIDDSDVARLMTRAIRLGIPVNQLSTLMEIARVKWRDFGVEGESVGDIFGRITSAIGRGTPKALVALGLIDRYDDSLKNIKGDLEENDISVEGLAIKHEMLAKVLANGAKELVGFDAALIINSERIAQAKAKLEEAQEKIGGAALRVGFLLLGMTGTVASYIELWVARLGAALGFFEKAINWAGEPIGINVGNNMKQFAEDSEKAFYEMRKQTLEYYDLSKKDADAARITTGPNPISPRSTSDRPAMAKEVSIEESAAERKLREQKEKADNEEWTRGWKIHQDHLKWVDELILKYKIVYQQTGKMNEQFMSPIEPGGFLRGKITGAKKIKGVSEEPVFEKEMSNAQRLSNQLGDSMTASFQEATSYLAQGFATAFGLGNSLLDRMIATFASSALMALPGLIANLASGGVTGNIFSVISAWMMASGGEVTTGGPLRFAAAGGNFNYGKLQNIIVGEKGPELMQIGMNGVRVISNQNMQALNQMSQASRGGGGGYNQQPIVLETRIRGNDIVLVQAKSSMSRKGRTM
jgi:hypothetical protein